jgi:putative spermidine/putrescine transport system substrate-binding protein
LREGYRGWGITLAPMKHLSGLKLDCFYEYMNWYTSGFQGGFHRARRVLLFGAGQCKEVPDRSGVGLLVRRQAGRDRHYRPLRQADGKAGRTRDGGAFWDRMGNIAVWNTVMDEDRYLTRRWNEFITS